MSAHIALLRAVNVGGRRMKMADLAVLAGDLGLKNPRTLLQSGNLVFETPCAPDAALETALEDEAEKRFGFRADVIVRSGVEWRAMIAANPFAKEAADDPSHMLAAPLKTPVADGGLEALRAAIKGRERVELAERTAFFVYPDGIGESKLTISVIEKKLGARVTARNWNTVLKLAEMARLTGGDGR